MPVWNRLNYLEWNITQLSPFCFLIWNFWEHSLRSDGSRNATHPSLFLSNSEMQVNACFSVSHLIGGKLLQLNLFGLRI